MKTKSKGTIKDLVLASDFKKEYLNLAEGTYEKNNAKLDQIEMIRIAPGIGVLRCVGNLSAPWYPGSQYSIDNLPEDFRPAYTVNDIVCGDIDLWIGANGSRIVFSPKTRREAGDAILFDKVFLLNSGFSGGGYKNPTKLFKTVRTCISKLTQERRLALCL